MRQSAHGHQRRWVRMLLVGACVTLRCDVKVLLWAKRKLNLTLLSTKEHVP